VPIPSPDLVFEQARLVGTPTDLVFGDTGVVQPPVTVEIAAALASNLLVSAIAALPIRVDAVASLLNSLTVSAAVTYDNRVTPWKDFRAASAHDVALPKHPDAGNAGWQTSLPKREGKGLAWTSAARRLPEHQAAFQPSLSKRNAAQTPWQLAIQRAQASAAAHQKATSKEVGGLQPWQLGAFRRAESLSGMQTGIFHVLLQAAQWQRATNLRHEHGGRSGASLHLKGRQFVGLPWQMAGVAKAGKENWPPDVEPPHDTWNADLLFDFPFSAGTPTPLVFGDVFIHPGQTVIVPIRRVYIVLNEVSLRRVDGNISLPTTGMTINLDRQSWTWGFSAKLPGRVLPDLEPSSYGVPVELEAMINGVAYRFLVDQPARDREFGRNDLKIQGRGKSSFLTDPYAPIQSFGNTAARTAQQLMADVLTLNGEPLGWSVDWYLEDWLVPAGVFSHQGSYISALNAIAGAAGGYIQPHPSLQRFNVLPGYPVVPWDWDTVTPDYELPADVVTLEGIKWAEFARYNRVYVSGQQAGGLGQVTRTGTAGDLLAPMVTDALITAPAAARQRGMSVLGNTGRQADVALRLPVLPETGVIPPGKFVRYVDGAEIRLGLTRSVSVDANFPEVWQNIGVETHVN
jgi:hypothetical protein